MTLEIHGILGEAAPVANTDATIYSCPTGRKVTISTLAVCNTNATASTYRLNARMAAASSAIGNRLSSDVSIDPGDTILITAGITLGPGDILSGRSNSGGVNFIAFGVEEDPV